jgi:lysozyme family protein
MAQMNFDTAFDRLIGHEGVLSIDPKDRGNWTSGKIGVGELRGSKYGISAMAYPNLDIKNLSLNQAKEIYRTDYWERSGAESYDGAIGYQVFDAAVNSGIENAVRFLQRAVRVVDDGHIGPRTIAAINGMSITDVLSRFNAQRLRFMSGLSVWDSQGRGWARRIAQNLEYQAEDA